VRESHHDIVIAGVRDADRLDALRRTGLDAAADPGLDRFAAMVRTVLGVPVALVSLVGRDRQFFPGACGLDQPWEGERQTPLSHSFCQHVVATAEPLVVVDARLDPLVRDSLAIDDLRVVGYAGMPLTDADGHVLGSLCVIDHQPRRWAEAELDLLSDLAAACSDILRLRIAARRATREQRRAQAQEQQTEAAYDRVQLLLRASVALGATGTLDDVAGTVRHLVLNPAYVDVSRHGDGPSAGRSAAAVAGILSAVTAGTGTMLLLPDLAAIAATVPAAVAGFEELGWQSAASAPLPGPRGPIGALTFAWKQPAVLEHGEQTVLAALAGYVAQALTRANALADRRTAAATMQKALLTPLPEHGRLRMAARYVPAHHEDQVGGDWYDAVRLDNDRLALVIGDVTGHSIDAAAIMSQYRGMLRTLLIDRHEPPSALLRRLEHTSRTLGHAGMSTVLLAYLDAHPDGGHTLTWSNAGHPPPTLLPPDGQPVLLEGCDPLLGAVRHASRRNYTLHLAAGSTLLLYTDGLVESRTRTIDDGVNHVHDLLRRYGNAEPEALADLLIRHTPSDTHEDDIALLVVATPAR